MNDNEQSVPYIQMSDLNDGDILNQTRKMSAGANAIILAYTLPSGQELKSEPVQADQIGKAMIQWIDIVKQRIVDDAAAAQDAAMRKARQAQMEKDSLAAHIPAAPPSDAELRAAGVPEAKQPPAEPAAIGPAEAPKQFAQRRVKELKGAVKMLKDAIKQRQKALKEAQDALAEWEGVVDGLTKKRARRAA